EDLVDLEHAARARAQVQTLLVTTYKMDLEGRAVVGERIEAKVRRAVLRHRDEPTELLRTHEALELGLRNIRIAVVENQALGPALALRTMSQKYSWTARSSVSSGWNVATSTLPWRAITGSSRHVASVSTPAPRRRMRGARMNTISTGVARCSSVALPRASNDSRCRP